MSHAVAALASLRAAIQALPLHAGLRPEPESSKLVEALHATEAARVPPADTLQVLRQRLEAAVLAGGAIEIGRRDLRSAPFVLWDAELAASVRPRLLDAVLRRAKTSDATLRNLIAAWLLRFDASRPEMASTGREIAALLGTARDRRLAIWDRAHRQFALFDPANGPTSLARALLGGPGECAAILADAGFDDPLLGASAYLKAVQQEMLAFAPAAFRLSSGEKAAERLAQIVAPDSVLRFRETRHGIAKGLLAAWLDAGAAPGDAVRDVVRDFLLKHLGDPRVRASNWAAVGDAEIALVRRWLARASLRVFFELIATHARDSQWRYREAFWTACLDRGAIDDAQLALAGRVHQSARATRELGDGFARLEGSGVQGDHSVLLLRVGTLVFCEWSHNGRLRVWPRDWKSAPRLDRRRYDRDDLMELGLPFPLNHFGKGGDGTGRGLSHFGSDRGHWQGSVAALLATQVGLRLTEADWQPR